MKYYVTLLVLFFILPSHAITLREASNAAHPGVYSYKPLFTNPLCKTYDYEIEIFPIKALLPIPLKSKPEGAWCNRGDSAVSGDRPESPQHQLIKWIQSPKTKEIFFTYLSFSNSAVTDALVEAIEQRGVKVTFIIDHPAYSGTRLAHDVPDEIMVKSRQAIQKSTLRDRRFFKYIFKTNNGGRWVPNSAASKALEVLNAVPPHPYQQPTLYLRGHDRSTLGYAHNKLFLINPNSEDEIKLVFSSGNMSSGVVLHHENWHFLELSTQTYFSQAHLCLMKSLINNGLTRRDFTRSMALCQTNIPFEEEEDIKTFFVPGRGSQAYKAIQAEIEEASYVDMAAHRFLHSDLINLLVEKVKSNKINMKLVVDDDLYWAKHDDPNGEPKRYPNNRQEFYKVQDLEKAGSQERSHRPGQGAQVKTNFRVHYMETNHWSHYLHHNKFMIFSNSFGKPKAVFAGAGNFTKAAFSNNYENFYMIKVPEVLKAFETQYKYLWGISTPPNNMPEVNVLPDGSSPKID